MDKVRVAVLDGSGKNFIGGGYLVGRVDVWLYRTPDGLRSATDAEKEPTPEMIKEAEAVGASFECVKGNPKIVMDNGRVVYGCQVWWTPVPDVEVRGRG